jgi:hypothetical protein
MKHNLRAVNRAYGIGTVINLCDPAFCRPLNAFDLALNLYPAYNRYA